MKDGSAGARIQKIIGDTKPEAVYFTEYGGQRGAIMIVNVEDASKLPSISEPWFLGFDADVEFHLVDDSRRPGQVRIGGPRQEMGMSQRGAIPVLMGFR